jgi:hypothetical protein
MFLVIMAKSIFDDECVELKILMWLNIISIMNFFMANIIPLYKGWNTTKQNTISSRIFCMI